MANFNEEKHTAEYLKAVCTAAREHVDAIRVGDEFTGAYGAAAACGYDDGGFARSIFTSVWLNAWDARRGSASDSIDGHFYVTAIDAL